MHCTKEPVLPRAEQRASRMEARWGKPASLNLDARMDSSGLEPPPSPMTPAPAQLLQLPQQNLPLALPADGGGRVSLWGERPLPVVPVVEGRHRVTPAGGLYFLSRVVQLTGLGLIADATTSATALPIHTVPAPRPDKEPPSSSQ